MISVVNTERDHINIDNQYNSASKGLSTTVRKGCSRSSGTVNRSRGSLQRQEHIKSLADSEVVVVLLNLI